jgi:rhodanese-related sulfurtransferase
MKNNTEPLLARAQERGRAQGLAYGGAVTPEEAHQLQGDGRAVIVDVRTRPEWEYVGHVPGSELIEWRGYGEQAPNPDFVAELARRYPRDKPILFLCRSAVRSHSAAVLAAKNDFTSAFNVLEGFEGAPDPSGQRNKLNGWRKAGLPWVQS